MILSRRLLETLSEEGIAAGLSAGKLGRGPMQQVTEFVDKFRYYCAGLFVFVRVHVCVLVHVCMHELICCIIFIRGHSRACMNQLGLLQLSCAAVQAATHPSRKNWEKLLSVEKVL